MKSDNEPSSSSFEFVLSWTARLRTPPKLDLPGPRRRFNWSPEVFFVLVRMTIPEPTIFIKEFDGLRVAKYEKFGSIRIVFFTSKVLVITSSVWASSPNFEACEMRPRVRFRKNKAELQISSPSWQPQAFFNARIKQLSAFSNLPIFSTIFHEWLDSSNYGINHCHQQTVSICHANFLIQMRSI